jgi:hypothetical protein
LPRTGALKHPVVEKLFLVSKYTKPTNQLLPHFFKGVSGSFCSILRLARQPNVWSKLSDRPWLDVVEFPRACEHAMGKAGGLSTERMKW